MAYYIISFESEIMIEFQRKISFLNGAAWIKEINDLAPIKTTSAVAAPYFFIHLTKKHAERIDEFVLVIRDTYITAKIVYVTEEKMQDMKNHQSTPVGGDAYVNMQIEPSNLSALLEGLMQLELNQYGSSAQNELSELGESYMSDKDHELSMDNLGDLEVNTDAPAEILIDDGGMELSIDDDMGLDLSGANDLAGNQILEESGELDLHESFSLDGVNAEADLCGDIDESDVTLSLDAPNEGVPDLDFSVYSNDGQDDVSLDLSSGDSDGLNLSDLSDEAFSLDLSEDSESPSVDLSDEALEKLKEIDAIMVHDASQVSIKTDESASLELDPVESNVETSLVSDDLDLGSISFSSDDEEKIERPNNAAARIKEERAKKKNKEAAKESYDGEIGRELKEISGAYSGEMERMQATISNLRSDREELLSKIQKQDDDKVLQNRQILTMRAELDEKKIELSIIRKKLNDEISELRDRLKLHDERKMILEEKNKILMIELDKAAQKNKIDVKKVQMRERELEQKLELLKSDSESQVRHRDLKILELKRKLDAMEFDVESISMQEKRSVESRFELEDKLDKAIKTLRSAITVLEDESDKSGALDALKKNIDM